MNYADLREILLPSILALTGVVMLFAGRGGGRLGGRLALVVGGAIVLCFMFYLVVVQTIR